MSSIGPGIAGSVAQAAAQQSDVARARDKVKQQDAREAQRLRDLLEKHVHEVEDSEQAEDDPLRVKDEQSHGQPRQPHRGKSDTAELSEEAEAADHPPAATPLQGPPPPPGRQIDIEA